MLIPLHADIGRLVEHFLSKEERLMFKIEEQLRYSIRITTAEPTNVLWSNPL